MYVYVCVRIWSEVYIGIRFYWLHLHASLVLCYGIRSEFRTYIHTYISTICMLSFYIKSNKWSSLYVCVCVCMIRRSQCAVQQVLHGLVYGCAHGYGSGLHLRGIATYIHHVSQWHHRLWWMLYCNTTYTYSSITIKYYYQYYIYYTYTPHYWMVVWMPLFLCPLLTHRYLWTIAAANTLQCLRWPCPWAASSPVWSMQCSGPSPPDGGYTTNFVCMYVCTVSITMCARTYTLM